MSPVPQPPFPPELLADLHAGNIDAATSAQLWPAVQHDPEARRYLDSLDELRSSLAGLAATERVTRPIPGDIAARLDAFAESLGDPTRQLPDGSGPAEPLGTPPPVSLDAYRRRKRAATGLAAAAALVIAAGAALFVGDSNEGDTAPTAAPAPTDSAAPDAELDSVVALRALGRNDVRGRLADPAALTACVRAAGIDRPVLGSTDMRFRGDDAVLILVGGRNGAQITALVVGAGCAPGRPEVLATTDIG